MPACCVLQKFLVDPAGIRHFLGKKVKNIHGTIPCHHLLCAKFHSNRFTRFCVIKQLTLIHRNIQSFAKIIILIYIRKINKSFAKNKFPLEKAWLFHVLCSFISLDVQWVLQKTFPNINAIIFIFPEGWCRTSSNNSPSTKRDKPIVLSADTSLKIAWPNIQQKLFLF